MERPVNRRAVNDEDLGIRLHEVNRQRAVDRAVERLRQGLKADWEYLTTDDVGNLRWLLGELWSTTDREGWDSLHFSKLEIEQARRLAGLGDRLRRHGTNKMTGLQDAAGMILAVATGQNGESASMDVAFATY